MKKFDSLSDSQKVELTKTISKKDTTFMQATRTLIHVWVMLTGDEHQNFPVENKVLADLSEKCNLSKNTISRWYNGETQHPSKLSLVRFCVFTNLPILIAIQFLSKACTFDIERKLADQVYISLIEDPRINSIYDANNYISKQKKIYEDQYGGIFKIDYL